MNRYVLIEPLKHKSFMLSNKDTFEEVGIVIESDVLGEIEKGDKVFFDSWLAAKYPKSETEYFWLVNYDDIRAYEKKNEISKLGV